MTKIFFLFFLFLFHLQIHAEKMGPPFEENLYSPLKVFAESLNFIETYYPKKKKRSQLIHGAIRGMLFELDPYSDFMTPSDKNTFTKQHQSSFGGIGIEIAFQNKQIIITSVYKNSPASKKGLKTGDMITHINNKPLQNLSFDSATKKLEGKIGDVLTLTIRRKNKPMNIPIQLDRFQISSVEGKIIEKSFFYIKISSFRESTFKEIKKILKIKKCRKNPQNKFCLLLKNGLIIDLRENSGGLVDQALLTADLFIPKGILITIKEREKKQKRVFNAKALGTANSYPIIVLTDRYSASASEILTAGLKDNNRALILGEKSFGKGSIQNIFDLHERYAIKLTVGHYYTPNGDPIEKRGISPDIALNFEDKKSLEIKKYDKLIKKYKNQFYSSSVSPLINKKKEDIENSNFTTQDYNIQQSLAVLKYFHSINSSN